MNEKDPEANLIRRGDGRPNVAVDRADVNDVEISIIRPESDSAAKGDARRRVQKERETGAGLIKPGYKDPTIDLMNPSTSRIVDAMVGVTFIAGFAACVSFGAPLALTGFVLGAGVMAIYDIIQHRMNGDENSIISRPGSMVKAAVSGIGVASTVVYGISGAAAAVAASAAAEVVLDDDGSASDLVEKVVETVSDISTWLWVALMTLCAYVVNKYVADPQRRPPFRSVLGRNYRRI